VPATPRIYLYNKRFVATGQPERTWTRAWLGLRGRGDLAGQQQWQQDVAEFGRG